MIDSHSHTKLSHDGHCKPSEMMRVAVEKGLDYYAITEHLDRDYKFCKKEKYCRQLNLPAYARKFAKAKETYAGSKTYIAYGVEAGYAEPASNIYLKELSEYPFDVIINSIHTVDGGDAYFPKFFEGKTQDSVYNRYLELVLESVRAPYDYDVIGHIGYITRYAPYENFSLWQPQYKDTLDVILKEIIARGKTVEINTHIRHAVMRFLPERPILARYFELGGRNITFSSDAHLKENIADRYEEIATMVKEIGFTDWTVYIKHTPHKIKI